MAFRVWALRAAATCGVKHSRMKVPGWEFGVESFSLQQVILQPHTQKIHISNILYDLYSCNLAARKALNNKSEIMYVYEREPCALQPPTANQVEKSQAI